jgi:DNA-binding helix-hairpin-helix protein with protein kinase domain/Flp pilus assembly protein TadD
MSQQFYSSEGSPISLGRKLGQGGEGAVFDVYGHSDLVAKVYLDAAIATKKAAKLSAMLTLKTERLLKLSAWPIDTLHDKKDGAVKGFVMPKVADHHDIHILYGIKSRHVQYPEARWPFLIQAAANVARAFSVIHEHGHVIGDVNQGGVVVSKSATVRLVDCDSFQISVNGNRYLCGVGVPTHTPPELQGRSFTGAVRTQDHDAFGLAVIIFQLLFLGRHPFSGGFVGRGDMPLEKAIQEFRFAYGPGATARQMKQPPATLPLDAVSTPLANLFERAFLTSGTRPRAQEWIAPLAALAKNLKQCHQNSGHSYLGTLSSCPWCKIESSSPGLVVFFPIYVAGVATATGTFNIAAIWTQIENVPVPGPLPALPIKSSVSVTPSPKATQIKRGRRLRSYISTVALAAISIVLIALPLGGGFTFFLILLATIGAVVFARIAGTDSAQALLLAKQDAERAWSDIQRRWPDQDHGQRFSSKLAELKTKKTEYENLATVLQRKLQQLEKEVYQRQLERYLDGYRIDQAQISGIGHARKITLRSYGLETAADITMNAVLSVPGFGPSYATKLLAWRSIIEQAFIFDPRRGVDPQDRRTVEADIQNRRAKLEQDFRNGVNVLRQLSDQAHSTHTSLRKSAEMAVKNLAQTEADLAAGNAAFSLIPLVVVFIVAIWAVALLRTNSPPQRAVFPGVATPSPSRQTEVVALSPQQIAVQAKSAYDNGVALSKAKKFSEAEAAYVQATTLRTDFAEAYHELGYVRFKLQKFDEAISALAQAHKLRPKYAETSRVLGQVYEAKENWSEAAKYYGEAAALQPKHALTQFNLGRALKNRGDLDSAIQAMQDAVNLKPDWAAAHYELALLYIETGEPEMAREQYTILATLDQKLADKLAARLHD